jgi:biopolymer transport protein TolR
MDQPVADADVVDKIRVLATDGPDTRIYLRASKTVPYGRVAELMGEVTSAGYKKVALVTEPPAK